MDYYAQTYKCYTILVKWAWKNMMNRLHAVSNAEELTIFRLQEEIHNLENQKELEEIEQQIIKDYSMIEGDYKVMITIYEASELVPKPDSFVVFNADKDHCNSFVQVQTLGEKKKSRVKKETNNPIFDEHFNFSFKNLRKQDLDNATIKFTVYDRSSLIIKKATTGVVELDWTSIYFRRNHQIYRGWLTISDPEEDNQGITGYLLASVAVLGPNDKMTIHDSKYIKDPLTTLEETITVQKLKTLDFTIKVQVYRAEHLIPVDGIIGGANAFVVAKFSGKKIKSSKKKSANPEWNQVLKIGTMVPTRSKYLLLELWDWNLITNQLIGTIKVPFAQLVQNKTIGPKWVNIYGPPLKGKDRQPHNYATSMQVNGQELGSHYRGRLLFKAEGILDAFSKTYRQKIIFKFPFKPAPNIPQRTYTFRASVIQGIQLPKSKACIQIAMGPYLLTSQTKTVGQDRCCKWLQNITEKRVVFPCDDTSLDQLPDIIVYLNSGESESSRISYRRIRALDILSGSHTLEIMTYQLQPDKSVGALESQECAGFVTLKIQLFTAAPPLPFEMKQIRADKVKYQLRIYLYLAQGLPPANVTGDCDSVIQFRCVGKTVRSQVKWNTRNPTWYSTICLSVELEDIKKSVCQNGVMGLVYDQDAKTKNNFIGKFWIPIVFNSKVHYKSNRGGCDLLYQKPKWFHISNPNFDFPHCQLGKVLVGHSLMQESDANFIPIPQSLVPRAELCKIQIYIIGLRSISLELQWTNSRAFISFTDALNYISTVQSRVKNGGCVFNSLFKTSLMIPHNKSLAPFMDVNINASVNNQALSFKGYNSVNLFQLVPNFYKFIHSKKHVQPVRQEKEEESSEESLLNVRRLQKQLDIIKMKRKRLQEFEQRQETERYRHTTFDKLRVPEELGIFPEASSTNEFQLNNLLSKFNEQFINARQFDHVRQLQKENDKLQAAPRSGRDMRLKVEREFNNQDDDHLLGSSLHFSELNKNTYQPTVNRQEQSQHFDSSRRKDTTLEETRLISRKIEVNSEAAMRRSAMEAENRFRQAARLHDVPELFQNGAHPGTQVVAIQGFSLGTSDAISSGNRMPDRTIKYNNVQRAYAQEKVHQKMARDKATNSKFAAAVKLSLYKWKNNESRPKDEETYEDFDTDPGEDLDITPQWYKGRKVLATDFEDIYSPTKKLKEIDILSGSSLYQGHQLRVAQKVASLKFIVLAYSKESEAEEKSKYYNRLMSPSIYLCRVYFLKGKSLVSEYHDKPTTSLRIKYGSQVIDLKSKTLVEESSSPEYYVSQDVVVQLPGPATIRVEVVQHRKVLKDHVLGFTDIDLEKRYFTKKWHLMLRKPIQLRNLYSEYGTGSQGRLQTWIQIIQRKQWENTPPQKIRPPPHEDFQLRIIVWETKDCVIKDEAEECNDIFVRGWVGTSACQDTDVHWRCRGTGSFNWRWKFPVTYPPTPEDVYGDVMTVQIWDKDLVGYNQLIGQARINLNRVHRIIQKAVKRKKPTKALMKIIEQGMDVTQKMYFNVFNDKKVDEFGDKVMQGKVLLSFQLVPVQQAKEKYNNGTGRSDPNLHPTLPDPEGRLSFSCRHPWEYLKQIFGLNFLRRCSRWCVTGVVILVVIIVVVIVISHVISNQTQQVKCVFPNQTTNATASVSFSGSPNALY